MIFGHTPERRQEIGFGLALLVSVALGLAGLEIGFRVYKAKDAEYTGNGVDWQGMVEAAGVPGAATKQPRFRPGGSFGHVRFNQFGVRGPDLQIPALPDLVRIGFLGDSKIMSADLTEDRTLPAQTAARLAAHVPACRFDYVAIAGPEYGIGMLADLWTEIAPSARPDLAVLLAGPANALAGSDTRRDNLPGAIPAPVQTWVDRGIADSKLWPALRSRGGQVASQLTPARQRDLGAAALAEAYRTNLAPMITALGPTPVLALGYRSRLRPDQPRAVQESYSQRLRAALPGLTIDQAVTLAEANVTELARNAHEAGWLFADPIAGLPPTDANFIDNSHFSDRGIAHLAEDLAARIAPLVQPDCTIALADRPVSDLDD